MDFDETSKNYFAIYETIRNNGGGDFVKMRKQETAH